MSLIITKNYINSFRNEGFKIIVKIKFFWLLAISSPMAPFSLNSPQHYFILGAPNILDAIHSCQPWKGIKHMVLC